MVSVHKIEFFIALHPIEDARGLLDTDSIPADMRHSLLHIKAFDRAFEKAQALDAECFLAMFKQRVHSQADSQKGPAGLQVGFERLDKLFRVQDFHHGAKSPHAGKHQLFSCQNIFSGSGHLHRLTQPFNGIDHTAHITGSIVE